MSENKGISSAGALQRVVSLAFILAKVCEQMQHSLLWPKFFLKPLLHRFSCDRRNPLLTPALLHCSAIGKITSKTDMWLSLLYIFMLPFFQKKLNPELHVIFRTNLAGYKNKARQEKVEGLS